MISSRGMGDIDPSKMPKGKKKAHRDDTDFTQYAKGGKVGLYDNMNARKKKGTSRSKAKSTVTPEAYANMKAGFTKGKK